SMTSELIEKIREIVAGAGVPVDGMSTFYIEGAATEFPVRGAIFPDGEARIYALLRDGRSVSVDSDILDAEYRVIGEEKGDFPSVEEALEAHPDTILVYETDRDRVSIYIL
ncbi:MAG: hypothetical protein DRQ04_06535, partial [Candidatus Hydrothermota bacterium]